MAEEFSYLRAKLNGGSLNRSSRDTIAQPSLQ